jgi:hypothetical protein
LAASRRGSDVLLLEAGANLGGTVANVLIHTIGGLFDSLGEFLNDGLPHELVERLQAADSRTRRRSMGRVEVLQVCPNVYRDTVKRWIMDETKITPWFGARVTEIQVEAARIVHLTVQVGEETLHVQPSAVVDATGSAAVARHLGLTNVAEESQYSAGGLIFRLRNVTPGAVEFPRGVGLVRAIRAAADSDKLPPACRHTWLDIGLEPDDVFVKLLIPLRAGSENSTRRNDDQQRAVELQTAVIAFLKRFPAFHDAVVSQSGSLGVRDGGRIVGCYTLTADDVRAGRTFDDGVCRCAWPIEYWDADRGVKIEYLPSSYQIPMRCLQLPRIENYWAAGKCLSADRIAHASARVAGSCWAMGQAAGIAAASFRQEERVIPHESVPGVSRDGATAARPAGNHQDGRGQSNVLPRVGRGDCQHEPAPASGRSAAG